LTYAGGLVIGVASAVSTELVAETPVLGGLPSALPFVVLFLVWYWPPATSPSIPTGGLLPSGRELSRYRVGGSFLSPG